MNRLQKSLVKYPFLYSYDTIAALLKSASDPAEGEADAPSAEPAIHIIFPAGFLLRLFGMLAFAAVSVLLYVLLNKGYWFQEFRFAVLSVWMLLFPLAAYAVSGGRKLALLSACKPCRKKSRMVLTAASAIIPLMAAPILMICCTKIAQTPAEQLEAVLTPILYAEHGVKWAAAVCCLLFFYLTVTRGIHYFIPLCGSGILLAGVFQWAEIHTGLLSPAQTYRLLLVSWLLGLAGFIIGFSIQAFAQKRALPHLK